LRCTTPPSCSTSSHVTNLLTALFSPNIVDLIRGASEPGGDRELLSQPEELSPSELRVLRYVLTNMTRPEIARALYLSINTVNTHMRNIYSKLGAHDRSSAVQRARHLGLISTRLSLS
jgi:LuxR family maltose regulon positive regulatory protein